MGGDVGGTGISWWSALKTGGIMGLALFALNWMRGGGKMASSMLLVAAAAGAYIYRDQIMSTVKNVAGIDDDTVSAPRQTREENVDTSNDPEQNPAFELN